MVSNLQVCIKTTKSLSQAFLSLTFLNFLLSELRFDTNSKFERFPILNNKFKLNRLFRVKGSVKEIQNEITIVLTSFQIMRPKKTLNSFKFQYYNVLIKIINPLIFPSTHISSI